MSNLSKQIANDTATHHFKLWVMPSMADALANIGAIKDIEVRKKTAQAYLVSSLIILAGLTGKDTLKEVTSYLRKEGLI